MKSATASHLNLIDGIVRCAGFHAQVIGNAVQVKLSRRPVFAATLLAIPDIADMYDEDLIDIASLNGIATIKVV